MVDQQGRRAAVDDLAQLAPEHRRLAGVEPGGRLVEAQQLGRLASALATATSLRWPCVSSLGGVGEPGEAEHLEGLVDQPEWTAVLASTSFTVVHAGCTRHREVLAHREVVEQLDRLPGAGHPTAGRACSGR